MASNLTVDDSASMRQMVSFTLKGASYVVTEAVNGAEALNIDQLIDDRVVTTAPTAYQGSSAYDSATF
jgi:chemotaxis response regulator CheB